jgi:hypothetical protein
MNVIKAIEIIKNKFIKQGKEQRIPKFRGCVFNTILKDNGIEVDNLGGYPLIPWAAFQEAICVLMRNGG